jgi:pyruvate/2-oxoglutarate dehydrogenase complex dihydrolipoamide acyltransferase (E2) component
VIPVIAFDGAWQETDEAVVTNWFFDDGATVSQGDLVAEVMLAKAAIEVRAPASGRLRILVPVEAVVPRGARLGEIG